jgi:hypothetical protein
LVNRTIRELPEITKLRMQVSWHIDKNTWWDRGEIYSLKQPN